MPVISNAPLCQDKIKGSKHYNLTSRSNTHRVDNNTYEIPELLYCVVYF